MANPLGRPRGTGGKPTKHATSEKHLAANRAKARLPHPGNRKPTDEERERAYEADRIGRTLCLEVVEQASHYLKGNLLAMKRFEEVLTDPWSTPEKIEAVRAARLSPTELTRMLEAIHNRWGQPPRSVIEVDGADRPPVMVFGPMEGWQAREDAHAAAAVGNGHGNGHTEH